MKDVFRSGENRTYEPRTKPLKIYTASLRTKDPVYSEVTRMAVTEGIPHSHCHR